MSSASAPVPRNGIGVRRPVDLGREGAEPLLVGHGLAGEGHAQQGPSVEAVVEGDDAAAPGGVAGHLDRVLDGLGAGVHEEGALLVVAGGQLVEPLAHLDVPEVRRDLEAGVGEGLDLLGTAAATRGALLPTLVTEIPDARSIRRLPSTSSTIPPPARATKTGSVVPTPAGTAAWRRSP